ncbi:MAG TPA: multifunctional oxoglutarate decarboxylase/oxoglutarate dehydrogenase thiamine pyrophosphate-binding subunit/dihydrolipoyllysine-residue succinyltransferase subunit [Candidatus Limnocylindrales bacterium]|jgi:2-oxoglutarate dehydrogenase E1 component|nr:multifunctional oxoglutarate decarboxylase/oxoglutarate dehydrogenase thiamine pyrophosphate-binding subunit/dihydrolipoyllysine-residue succinyltransferase subunit [Candidatus Limnocylindrales bacterium]
MAIRDRGPAGLTPDPAAGAAELPTRRVDHGAEPPAAGGDHATTNPIQGVEARLVARMSESLGVPTATSFREIDVAMLEAERARLNEALAPRRLSYTHLLGYAVAQAVAVHPPMAAFYREIDGRPHRIEPARIGLGLAVDVEQRDGTRLLVVPVIAGADDLTFPEFVAAYDDLLERARAGRLAADDLAGGTVTLTNPGTVGTTASVPRLMAGQGTIVATGAIRHVGGQRLMTVSSTYDHRVIQGAQSGLFLGTIDELLEGADGFYDHIAASLGLPRPDPAATVGALAPQPPGEPAAAPADIAAAMALVRSYRTVGHRAVHLDPLGSEPPGDPSLDPATWGLIESAMARVPASLLRVDVPGDSLAEVVPELQRTYCGTTAFEVEHLSSHDERAWLRRAIESGRYRTAWTADQRRRVLTRLTAVEAFEHFLQDAYLGQKRFSIEGLDAIVPMLDQLIELLASSGTRAVEIGMTHRGRLNVVAHIVGVPYAEILTDFERSRPTAEAEAPAEGETSDVKYHRGADGVYESARGPVRVIITSNPSHLEAIDPVVEGRARAAQTDRRGPEPVRDATVAVPVLIHGDASFAAQGVVAETFNLARLAGYTTGGTIHLIANNQLGFTVEPRDGRSTDYASDLAKGFDVPIVHVNADDPEACLDAVSLAHGYRNRFHGDFVIDVVGYRRYGHNEGDEPAYTQPVMYELIGAHPTVRQIYARRLAAEDGTGEGQAEEELAAAEGRLAEIQTSLEANPTVESISPVGSRPSTGLGRSPRTAVAAERLRAINEGLLAVPPGFTVHPKLTGQFDRRREALAPGGRIAWAHAEALAFGSLLLDGTPIRLTGQDTERGTFSQRHLVFHDATDGRRYAPIQHLPEAKAPFELHDSPLSEFACLGFEYGYAVEAQEALVLWEAQYGDFANEAEVVIDQFIIAGLAKWGESSRLTLLLPHGYEGQGPEHSSARLERYLALGAEDNVRVANCTTPAQYFHLLRDQARREVPRPLVLMTPKGLLRMPAASSSLDDLTRGRFRPVLDDADRTGKAGAIRRLVLCSGRIYYDLVLSERRAKVPDVAVARLELLYPFPTAQLRRLLDHYPNVETVVWAQEEPGNMGARKFVLPKLREIVPARMPIVDVARPERSSPAEGSHAAHRAEQARILDETLVG